MSRPQTVWQFLGEFNACLQTGFRNRHRIILEVSDHFRQRVSAEVRRGASRAVAEQRAIAAFGSAQEVARGFQRGPVVALDRRVGVAARRVRGWTVSHPWRVTALYVVLGVLFAGAVAAMAALAGAAADDARRGALWLLASTLLAAGLYGRHAPLRRIIRSRETREAQPGDWASADAAGWLMIFAGTGWGFIVAALEPSVGLAVLAWAMVCWIGAMLAAEWAIARVADRLARRVSRDHDGPAAWWDERPYVASLCSVASAPIGVIVMVLAYHPAPLELRGAYAALTAGATLLLAAGWCLAYSQDYQDGYARYCEDRS